MKKILLLVLFAAFAQIAFCQTDLKIVMIRHGEKPVKGDNLTCQGLNRSLALPNVLKAKFGIPEYVFVPALGLGEATKHSRMFQTIVPFAAKYNLTVNTSHAEKDSAQIAADFKSKKGTIIMVWEHKAIAPIVRALGVKDLNLLWPDDDYDSIWIVTFHNGVPTFTREKEGLKPSADCPF